MLRFRPFHLLLGSFLLASAGLAQAGGTEDFGDYRVHYNALATDQLPPEVASVYNIVRSRNRAMLNVSVTRDVPGTIGESVQAKVDVTASNLTGQVKDLRLRKIEEKGDWPAFYYIGEVSVADGETLKFDIKVTPEGSDETYEITFQQRFYTN